MHRRIVMKTLSLVLLASTLIPVGALSADRAALSFNFDGDAAGQAPHGFEFGRTGRGAPGKWTVKAEEDAPSGGNVLAQSDPDSTDYRFPVAFTGPALKDLRLSVKCKPVSGRVDQGCGLVFRLKDADNYYVARANSLEDNVRLYHVVSGKRVQFATWSGKVKSGIWHELSVDAQGDHFQVSLDGTQIIDAHDKTLTEAGKFGLWTKADSIIYFDDLKATPAE
jgi:hypothetical protein